MWKPLRGPVRPLARHDDGKYNHCGSCVLVRFGTELFVFSAAHVLDEADDLFIAGPDGFAFLGGEVFKTPIPEGGTRDDDPLDVGILRVTGIGGEFTDAGFLEASDLDVDDSALGESIPNVYQLIAYPAEKAWFNPVDLISNYEALLLNSMPLSPDRYAALGKDDRLHVALEFDRPKVLSADRSEAPDPHGASGGGIFRPEIDSSGIGRSAKLVAIAIETEHKAIFGTRISLFCEILRDKFPALRNQIPQTARPIA